MAPSSYLKRLQNELDEYNSEHETTVELGQVLSTHCVEIKQLEADDFDSFYEKRKEALALLIEKKTGLKVVRGEPGEAANVSDDMDDYVSEEVNA